MEGTESDFNNIYLDIADGIPGNDQGGGSLARKSSNGSNQKDPNNESFSSRMGNMKRSNTRLGVAA